MKLKNKILATIFIFTLSLALASCKGKDQSVTYVNATDKETYSFVFNKDSTFAMHYHLEQNTSWDSLLSETDLSDPVKFSIIYDYDVISGTYTGKPASNGKIQMIVNQKIYIPDGSDMQSKITNFLLAGNSTMTVTNEDYPLVPISSSDEQNPSGTINGKTLTIGNVNFIRK